MNLLENLNKFLDWPVILYLASILLLFYGVEKWFQYKRKKLAHQRQKVGLPKNTLMSSAELSQTMLEAKIQSLVFILVVLAPVLLGSIFQLLNKKLPEGLTIAFVVILLWSLTQGTDFAKAFLGGLAFKTLIAFQRPIQVGDRVQIQGYTGKVENIGTFFVKLRTYHGELVSIPTRDLWSSVLLSVNAGERYSMCVIKFYLAPTVTIEQRQQAEDIIWEAIQASPYFEISKPLQIYISQTQEAIILTAKAYLASTYNEPLFKSEVYTAFLNYTSEKAIPLSTYHFVENY